MDPHAHRATGHTNHPATHPRPRGSSVMTTRVQAFRAVMDKPIEEGLNMRKSFRSLCVAVMLAGALLALVVAPALASPHIFSTSFGSGGAEAGQVSLAFNSGVAVNATTHDVYVADTGNHRVDQFSSSGTFIRAWGWGVADGLPAFEECALTCQAGL